MIKKIATILVALVMIILGFTILACAQDIDVEISNNSNEILVLENISLNSFSDKIIDVWIQSGHMNVSFSIDGTEIDISPSTNTYSINLSELNIENASYLEVKYSLDKDTKYYSKIIQYNQTSISLIYDGTELLTSSNLQSGSSLNVALQKPTGQVIIETNEIIPTWTYAIIVILIILLLASFIRTTKKPESAEKKKFISESEELLNTKKAVLMEALKNIEKQYRAKKISDYTYHKLKNQFKNEAVIAMKKLDDIKSKVK